MRRRSVVIGGLALGGLMLVTAGQTWVEATGLGGGVATSAQASGSAAAPVATAMALVVMAASLALTTARRFGVLVIGGLMALAGLVAASSAVSAALDPEHTASAAVAELTGTTAPAQGYAVTVWPWLCAAGGALAVVLGLAAILSRHAWGSARRYETPAAGTTTAAGTQGPARTGESAPGAAGSADPVTGTAAGSAAARASAADLESDGHLDEMDAWDELSRGNDPT